MDKGLMRVTEEKEGKREAVEPSIFTDHDRETTIGIFGQVSSGYDQVLCAEIIDLLSTGRRVCIIDPVGSWRGMTQTSAGSGLTVFGGPHSGRAFTVDNADMVGGFVSEMSMSCIVDASRLDHQQRIDAYHAFLHRIQSDNRSPLTLILAEASLVAPNNGRGGGGHRASHPIIKLAGGRGATGISLVVASWNVANVNHSLLSMIDTVAAMRMGVKRDRNAVKQSLAGGISSSVVDSLEVLTEGTGLQWNNGGHGGTTMFIQPSCSYPSSPVSTLAPRDVDLREVDRKLAGLMPPTALITPSPAQTRALPSDGDDASKHDDAALRSDTGHRFGSIDPSVYDKGLSRKDAVVMKAVGTGEAPRSTLKGWVSSGVSAKEFDKVLDDLIRRGHLLETDRGVRLTMQAHREFHMSGEMRSLQLAISKGRDPFVEGAERRWAVKKTTSILEALVQRGYVTQHDGQYVDMLSSRDVKS